MFSANGHVHYVTAGVIIVLVIRAVHSDRMVGNRDCHPSAVAALKLAFTSREAFLG
jgi:hypothetical protein